MGRWLGPIGAIGLLVAGAWWVAGSLASAEVQQTKVPAPAAATRVVFDSNKAFEHLRQLVSIGPRPAGSAALRQTRAYITRQISAIGLTVQEQPFVAASPRGPVEMMNLIVRVPGRRTDRILFTGHYDTKTLPGQSFVGANDGASSAAFLIELARVLKTGPAPEFTYELVWLDGEEAFCMDWNECSRPGVPDHTYGSIYYVESAKRANALATIKAMILVDMIGDRNLQIRRESKSTRWLTDLIWAAAKRVGHSDTFVNVETDIEDDHVPFLEAGVAAVDIIDLDYPQWHNQTCCDTLDHVGARSLQIVGDVLLAALPDLERRLAR